MLRPTLATIRSLFPSEEHDFSADAGMTELYNFLIARGVRRDLLRLSFHIYNNEADIKRVVGLR